MFNIDAATGVLTFKNAPDWEAPLDAGGDNVYEVNVIAVGAGSGDGQFVSVVVEDVDDTTPGGGPTETITLEAEALTLDGNFFISGKDTGASGGLIIRARPGNNTGTATTTFGGASGTYRLTLDAYDENDGVGRLNVKVNGQTVSTTVLDQDLGQAGPRAGSRRQIVVDDLVLSTNDLIEIMGVSNGGEYTSLDKLTFEPIGPADVPVEIISNGGGNTAFINVDEGTSAVTGFEVNVGDDNVLYRINAGADRDFFEIDPQTGQLSFKSAPDFQQPLDAGANNVYEVNVVAIGANSGDGQFVSVKVNDVVLPGGPDATFDVVEGIRSVADIDVSGSQAGASFRINAGADRDLFFINPETGVLSFKRSPDFENPTDRAEGNAIAGDNLYEVNVLATNGNQTESKFITVAVKDVDESTLPDPISVYLLAGQSNLVGEAQVANLTDTSYVQPFSVAQIWSRPQVDFVDLAPGFDGQMVELGPELSFGRQIVDKTGENVLLIKYGLGSTTLAEDWQKDGSGTQFNKLKDIVDVALDSLTNQGLTYDIEGLVWMQGESDTYNDAFAGAYEDNLLGFVDGVRDVYGENLDVAVGLIRNDLPTSARNRELVRDAQRVVSAGDSKVFLVDTDALGGSEVLRPGDTTHYNADGQILLGNAFADAFVG
ncbi:MAG: sialate O-acetylesterase [Cyanobacteria bacterium J06621_11]